MKRREFLAAAPALALAASPGFAQGFPKKPIRYIVPVAAGGGNDMIARTVCERWGKVLGQPFVVDNQGGGILKELKSNFLCLPADMRTRLSRFIAFAKETGNSIMSWKGGLDKDFFFTKFKIYAVGLFKQTFEALQTLIVADSECAVMVQMKLFSNCIDEMNAVSA